jgi:N utilization substance protein B
LEFDRDNVEQKLGQFWQEHDCSPQIREFAESLVNGTLEHLNQIDELISQQAINWRLARMAMVDRNILRFSTYEILYRDDIPMKVSINEALEIAKKYSTPESASFINGILDKIAHQR